LFREVGAEDPIAIPGPQESVCGTEFRSLHGALKHTELMAEGEDLKLKAARLRSDAKTDARIAQKTGPTEIEERETILGLSATSEFMGTTDPERPRPSPIESGLPRLLTSQVRT